MIGFHNISLLMLFYLYSGSLADSSDRHSNYLMYMANAALQGIAGYDADGRAKEDAKFSVISEVNYTLLPRPSKYFSVNASEKWNPSGFAIQEGEIYQITVSNSQYWTDGPIQVDADGYSSYFDPAADCFFALGQCNSYLKKKRRFAANWMSLICGIGQFVRPLGAIQPGNEAATYWLPLDESSIIDTLIHVGRSASFSASYTGELICFANDAHPNYWNNAGALKVLATRVSWPPTNTSYYQKLYIPACDSANAVYANLGTNVTNPVFHCNPEGGGSGWTYHDTVRTADSFSSDAMITTAK